MDTPEQSDLKTLLASADEGTRSQYTVLLERLSHLNLTAAARRQILMALLNEQRDRERLDLPMPKADHSSARDCREKPQP